MMSYDEWLVSITPDPVYRALCAAGLGDTPQSDITCEMYERAMRGYQVKDSRNNRNRNLREAWERPAASSPAREARATAEDCSKPGQVDHGR